MTGRRGHNGFTLVESLVAAVVLAIAVVAISVAVSSGHMQSYDAVRGRRAIRLAEEMMEFILALPYDDPQGASLPGPEADEPQRSDFDNMDDFDGYVDPPGPPTDMHGIAYGQEYEGLSRSVTAQYGSETLSALGCTVPGLTVTVAVCDPKGRIWQVSRFVPKPTD
jgi:prepilin-type N-terminal cleavage/methylation domain-containing protein